VASAAADDSDKPHVVILIAEREYQTDQTLPKFANQHLKGYRTTFVFADPNDRNRLLGIESISHADVLMVSVRRRTLPAEQLNQVRKYVADGKPVIGIRTANHAFCLRNQVPEQGRAEWKSWDRDVFGGNYTNHYGNKLETTYQLSENAPTALVTGLTAGKTFTAGGSLYKVSPLADGAQVVLTGAVAGNPAEPMAWTFTRADGGKSFYTSLGHVDDFAGAVLPQLLKNVVDWSLKP
jgi:type 1 glutamine amidotransferase